MYIIIIGLIIVSKIGVPISHINEFLDLPVDNKDFYISMVLTFF